MEIVDAFLFAVNLLLQVALYLFNQFDSKLFLLLVKRSDWIKSFNHRMVFIKQAFKRMKCEIKFIYRIFAYLNQINLFCLVLPDITPSFLFVSSIFKVRFEKFDLKFSLKSFSEHHLKFFVRHQGAWSFGLGPFN